MREEHELAIICQIVYDGKETILPILWVQDSQMLATRLRVGCQAPIMTSNLK